MYKSIRAALTLPQPQVIPMNSPVSVPQSLFERRSLGIADQIIAIVAARFEMC